MNIELDKQTVLSILQDKTIIDPISKCWIYTSSLSHGYGNLWVQDKSYRVNRLSLWIYENMPLNSPLFACHKLECKNKDCWNPNHLYQGNRIDNSLDMIQTSKNHVGAQTHCKNGHKFTEKNTYLCGDLTKKRSCRKCHAIREANRRKQAKIA